MKFPTMIISVVLGVLAVCSVGADTDLPWWKVGPVYQIYPTSYADSDGDGWGDLQGIISHAEYIEKTGVAAIWLSPIYPSPMRDNGYDASNYTDVNPKLGNLSVADNLIKTFHSKGIKVILDFVPNHTSNDSAWFQDSIHRRNGKDDWYVWRDPKGFTQGVPLPPNNWRSLFGGSAWTYVPERKQFYFHQFGDYQPDLNYENPDVVNGIQDCIKFWLSRGIDGFRMDAVPFIAESHYDLDETVKCSDQSDYNCLEHIYTTNQPKTHEVLNGFDSVLREDVFTKDNNPRAMWVESYNNITELMKYFGNVSSPFNFQYISYIKKNSNASDFEKYTLEFMNNLNGHWPNWVVGNHDQSRVGTRMGSDMIDSMNIINQLLPGTSIVYYGEELGMVDTQNIPDNRRQDYASNPSRDPERTPMQWDTSENAGFSTADSSKLYLPLNSNYYAINAKNESGSENSHLDVFRKAVQMHKDHIKSTPQGIKTGTWNGWIFAFQRPGLVVVTNLNNEEETFKIEDLKLNKTDSLSVALAPQNKAFNVGRKVSPTEKITILPRTTIVFKTSGAGFLQISSILLAASFLLLQQNH